MLSQFSDDAEMTFDGISVGPFRGRASIERAYAENPPDDEITILRTEELGDTLRAEYAWSKNPKVKAGEMVLTTMKGKISRLVIHYER